MSKLKKANAILGLLTILLIILHVGYNVFCYLAMYYNETLKILFDIPFMVTACLHAILGMLSVFLLSDGTNLIHYPKYNRRTIVQRLTAALIIPMLILHLNTYAMLTITQANGWTFLSILLIIAEVLFYGVVIAHISVSLSRGLVTLGILKSPEAQKKCDRAADVIGAIVFAFASIAVIRGQLIIFF